MWNSIKTEQDIADLMVIYDNFHDSCIKEIQYVSGAFVNTDLSMHAINDCRCLRIAFQRQSTNPFAIELEFSELVRFNLEPAGENYSCEILDVSMFFENNQIFWGDSERFAIERDSYQGTWICSNSARWKLL